MAGTAATPSEKKEQLESGTYELIQRRLASQAEELRSRMDSLNRERKEVFGTVDVQLIATDRINTVNNCVPRDMFALGECFIFGYNVHMGLRKKVKISDVFSIYHFRSSDHSFHHNESDLLDNSSFKEDFHNLYKYYKDTVFVKFARIGPHLFMVFQVGKSSDDIKTFKWAIVEDGLTYLGNRFDHEFKYPEQHQFNWIRTTRDMQRRGEHPHVSILDKVFVETIGGDLTIKVEDNTASGKGIYTEAVDHPDQTLDDADYYYADLGNILILKVRPYQERNFRYLIFNQKVKEVLRADAIEKACVLLPDEQGIIFSNGYYLQTGEYKLFDKVMPNLSFERRIASSNGEDFLYIFSNMEKGIYVLLPYNIVQQQVENPIICNGSTIFPNGELCYFKTEDQPGRHHVVQVWQTPYGTYAPPASEHSDKWLFKVGNKDLVRGMAECNELFVLLQKEDSYDDLYIDLVKKASDILDSYYWIQREEAMDLGKPLHAIRETAAAAIDEYEKVRRIKQSSQQAVKEVSEKTLSLLDKIRRYKAKDIDTFVSYLAKLRALRGELIGTKELRYVDVGDIEAFEEKVKEASEKTARQTVEFLLDPEALLPYQTKVDDTREALQAIQKVSEANEVEERIDGISKELELLIDIVSNLQIDDATQTTRIIDNISGIYASLNQLRASLKKERKELRGAEAKEEFHAQIRLLEQGLINYLDLSDSPAKCDEYLSKLMIQLEELEGKFADYETFVLQLSEKREEIYSAFETRKLSLTEARNKKAQSLMNAADRILKGIQNRVSRFKEISEINAYFAADLMIDKVRDIIRQLEDMEDPIKAGDIQGRLKSLQEDGIRQLRDKNELFLDGENIIRLGRHPFAVSTQNLDLNVMLKGEDMYFHLTGTSFFEKITDPEFQQTREVWDMSLISETKQVYRAEYLANLLIGQKLNEEDLDNEVRSFMSTRFSEGYSKGIHDRDASAIYRALKNIEAQADLLRFPPKLRAGAQFFWNGLLAEEERQMWKQRIQGAAAVRKAFPQSGTFEALLHKLEERLLQSLDWNDLFEQLSPAESAHYLFEELIDGEGFVIAEQASQMLEDFGKYLQQKQLQDNFRRGQEDLRDAPFDRYELLRHWLLSFLKSYHPDLVQSPYVWEACSLLFADTHDKKRVQSVQMSQTLEGMLGDHPLIEEGNYALNYYDFQERLQVHVDQVIPLYRRFTQLKKELSDSFREELRLEEFRPRVLTSFVRNQLIDKVYLPMVGDNLAKQLGTAGENTRTDRQGLLLLVSPPGYGKTTLMEYVANRLGLIFMKINGPAIGHHVTSLDPAEAPNAAAREELGKLNLSLEMGDNVMIYLDDIQHCHPEFLQKFISLCDAQRKIEGVYRGKTRTYDLRGKKVAVVMAGNPYTESGEKFRIPDMLANRADTYNLGDILGDSEDLFKLSYLENSLTANPVLHHLSTKPRKDILRLIRMAEGKEGEGADFETHFTPEESQEYVAILSKLMKIRDVILRVNQEYISSAAQQDEYRIEPPFKLQGSYRNMNRMAEKVQALMNEEELTTLILSHYESEAQTLTRAAEANLLKFKMMTGFATSEDEARWKEIVEMFLKQKNLSADRMAQLVQEMEAFTQGLDAIKNVLASALHPQNDKKEVE